MKNDKTPAIRFKGFTEAWEQRKLHQISLLSKGEQLGKNAMSSTGPYYVLNGGKEPSGYTNNYNTEANTISISEGGNSCGYVNYNTEKYWSGGHNYTLTSLKLNNSYLFSYLKFKENQIMSMRVGSGLPNIQKSSLNELPISYPLSEEQKLIGNFFNHLDTLITLHQRKCDVLMNIKKSLFEKMFPTNGDDKPRIRFKGFTEAWEQRKITELGKIFIGLVTTMTAHYTEEGALLIRNSDIKDCRFEFNENKIFLEKSFASAYESRMHQIGDVITVHTGDVGTSAVISENEYKSIGFATIVTRPYKNVISSNYLCTFLNTEKHKRWAVAISTGDGRTNYNLGDYYELIVPVPSIEEQKKIAKIISNLNSLITLHQRKEKS